MNPSALTSSVNLRPRNRRRTHEDEDDNPLPLPAMQHHDINTASTSPPRGVSPSSRSTQTQTTRRAPVQTSFNQFLRVPDLDSSKASTSTLWGNTWSSLRTLASDVIGNHASRPSSPAISPDRDRGHHKATPGRHSSAPAAPWGPSAPTNVGVGRGTIEGRRAELEAKKRERLLMANGHVTLDTSGRYKRRGSDERNRVLVPSSEIEEREALVYVHKVKPGDTLAGVMIKYNCQSQVFRKVNRLWPNDSIQVRKIVLLPVDACSVRGRKVSDSELPLQNHEQEVTPGSMATQPSLTGEYKKHEEKDTPFSSIPTSPSISISFSNPEEPYKHDSWVIIDGISEVIEIARLSRRALGYFPRSRRKSLSSSDLDSPMPSLDLPRGSFQSDLSPRPARSRSSSLANLQARAGGVGTMNRNVRSPGPANDGLNRLFPTLEQRMVSKPVLEFQDLSSSGLEHVGGAIEGWVRKVASKASSSFQSPALSGRPGEGDLIELSEDAFDLGESHSHSEGRQNTALAGLEHRDPNAANDVLGYDSFEPRGRTFGDLSRRRG